MKKLKQDVNSMVLEEAMKKAKPLSEQMGLKSVPDDMLEMIYPNLNYSQQFTPSLYVRFQRAKALLKELSDQAMPKHGHIVKYTNQYGSYDDSVLLLKEGEIRKQNLIACVGSKNIGDFELQHYGLDMHVGCGGPFDPISEAHIQSLSEYDFYETTYNFWGATPCGNGMINVTVPMKRWFLTV